MKKYRLKINYSEVTNDNFDDVAELRSSNIDGEICQYMEYDRGERIGDAKPNSEGFGLFNFGGSDHFFIKASWLTEIKDPKTCAEFLDEKYSNAIVSKKIEIEYIWNSAVENERLKIFNSLEKAKKQFIEDRLEGQKMPEDFNVFISSLNHVFNIIEGVTNDNT